MADPRTFTLIGEFKDGITPELEKINKQLGNLKTTFSSLGVKESRKTTRTLGALATSVSAVTTNLKEQQRQLRQTTQSLREYRLELAKASRAGRMGGQGAALAREMRQANTEAKALLSTLKQIQQVQPRVVRPPRGGGGGGRGGSGRTPGNGPGGFHMAEFGFAYTLGNAIAQPVQNAIVGGFQIGVGLMMRPFEYFANRLGERMQDELSDLKAAGGFFSMARRQKDPFVKNFADAIQFTQENNLMMAKLAASLPGRTQDYIEVSKRISDSVARTVLADRAATIKMAEEIRAKDVRTYGAKSITEMTGEAATKKTIQVLLGDLTKDTVLAGMGGRAGAGGQMGAYGLPQLAERMISQDEVSMGQMQRYSAIFSDPMIMDALQRNIDKINATNKNSAKRLDAIRKMYQEVVTPELIERYRRTLSGIAETFNTAIFGEETGIFGLGRKMEGLGVKFNELGQMIDENGKVVTKVSEAAKENLSIYDLFRDILVNVGQVVAPIVENLALLYDPLRELGLDLGKARQFTYKLLESFNFYKKGFEDFANQFTGANKETMTSTSSLRAAMATIGNLMRFFKVIGEGDFKNLISQLEDPKADMGKILKGLIDTFVKSDVAQKVGEFIGTIIGTVISEVAQVTGFISGRLEGSNKLFKGIKKGFEDAGGPAAFTNIFKDVFSIMFKVLLEIGKILPIEAYILGAAMLVIPAAIQGLGMAIAQGVVGALGKIGAGIGPQLGRAVITGSGGAAARAAGGGGLLGGAFTTRRQAAAARMARGRIGAAAAPMMQGARTLGAFGKDSFKGLTMALNKSKFGTAITKVAKFIPGGAVAVGALDAGIRMMSGQGAAQALGGAGAAMGGSAIGAMIGSVFAPGIGTAIGGIAGGLIGDYAFQKISPVITQLWPWADRQKAAADVQLAAADKQMAAADETRRRLGIPDVGAAKPGVTDPGKLMQVIQMLGLSGDQQAKTLLQQSGNLQLLTTRTDEAGRLLNAKIKELRNLKYTDAQIASQADVKALQENFNRLQGASKRAAIDLDKTFKAMPQSTSRAISTAMNKMDTTTIAYAIANKINMMPTPTLKPGAPQGPGLPSPIFTSPKPSKKNEWALGNPFPGAKGSLGDAISSEVKNKPRGSSLVIANSSETVIPAAGGNGVGALINTFRSGLNSIANVLKLNEEKNRSTLEKINQTLISNQTQTNSRLGKLETKMSIGGGMPGGLGGASAGGVDAFTGMASRFGLTMTSGYRPGDPGWHGANRARDFSNGTGPTPQMLQFAQYLATTYGSNLKELIYTPLGFSIKNGQRVAPYAQGSHYNHVHVAYATGYGMPFTTAVEAMRYERAMVPGSVKVGSITGNSAEGFGGSYTLNNNITIQQQPGESMEDLAATVVQYMSDWVADARGASLFV